MILPLYANLEKHDPTLIEAAVDLGCTPGQGVLEGHRAAGRARASSPAASWSSSRPSASSSSPTCSAARDTLMIGKTLWTEFFNNRDWPLASAVAVILLLVLVVPIALFQRQQAAQIEERR